MVDVRELFLETGAVAVDVVGDPAVAEAWSMPSALPGMTVGALAAHLARALSTVRRYLDLEPPSGGGPPLDAAGYLVAVLPDTDREAPVNRAVLGRAIEGADVGAPAVRAGAADDLAWLRRSLGPLDHGRVLSVLGGTPVRLEEYLATRIVEFVVHLDDLEHSVPALGPAAVPDEAGALAVGVLAEAARRRTSTAAMVALLARRERVGDEPPRAF